MTLTPGPVRKVTLLLLLTFTLLAASATVALAGPVLSPPMIGVAELQQIIDASGGTADGYFKTVLKGSTVVEIPVEIQAVTGGFATGPDDLGSLILFHAYGTDIDRIGGIAAGMSGSPLYVASGGDTYLVGAVSYGDIFTLGGTGLATPIMAMKSIENYEPMLAPDVLSLPVPIVTDGGIKTEVILTQDGSGLKSASDAGALVAKPLAPIFVAGLKPGSSMYQAFSSHLSKLGYTVTPMSGLASMESTYDAAFQPGSAVAALAASGDLWVGGVGTVTYTNGPRVLAFGHPMFLSGATGLFLNNAWVDGIWPSSISPYKLARPAALRGTLTQDRSAGILGVDGLMPEITPVTATCVNADTGRVTSSTVSIPHFVMDSGLPEYSGLSAYAAYIAGSRQVDGGSLAGSALTTTTVVVCDGESDPITIVRTGLLDDPYDITSAVINDAWMVTADLQSLIGNGLTEPHIMSLDVQSTISRRRMLAQVVGVSAEGGLQSGDNTVTVSYLKHGVLATQTTDVVLNIPEGIPTDGVLSASGPMSPWGFDEGSIGADDPTQEIYVDRRTVAEVADLWQGDSGADILSVTYAPNELADPNAALPAAPVRFDPITVEEHTGTYLAGAASMSAPKLACTPVEPVIDFLGMADVNVEYSGGSDVTTVTVYARAQGSDTEEVVGEFSIDPEYTASSLQSFGPFDRNVTLRFASTVGTSTLAVTQTSIDVQVRADVALTRSRANVRWGHTSTLTAAVSSEVASGSVRFERWSPLRHRWVSAGIGSTRRLAAGQGFASYRVRVFYTSRYRARFIAAPDSGNLSNVSNSVKIRIVR